MTTLVGGRSLAAPGEGVVTKLTRFVPPSGNRPSETPSDAWSKKGTFVIKAKAKDVSGLEGLEGTFSVKMPKAFSVNAVLMRLFYRFPVLKQLLSR